MKKGPKYVVAPARGRYNRAKQGRYNVIDARQRTVMRGPFISEALAQLIADAMNEAHEEARKGSK